MRLSGRKTAIFSTYEEACEQYGESVASILSYSQPLLPHTWAESMPPTDHAQF